MVYKVIVGVCLERPPKIDEYRQYVIEAESASIAKLIALQMASCTSEMPVYAR